MRNLFILLGSALLFGSCASKPPKDHGPGYCDIDCNTPKIVVNLDNLPASELSKAVFKRFTADGCYCNLIDTIGSRPFVVSDAFDYEIVLTSGKVVSIGGIKITPTTTYDHCGTTCSDALVNFGLSYDYKPKPIQWELSADKKEYTVYMK